jgi:hypothetical protein
MTPLAPLKLLSTQHLPNHGIHKSPKHKKKSSDPSCEHAQFSSEALTVGDVILGGHSPLRFRPCHKMAFKPFGFGPRACPGRRLAEQELSLLTVAILKNFRVSYPHGEMGSVTKQFNVPDKPFCFTFEDLE